MQYRETTDVGDVHDVVALCSELSNLAAAGGGLDEVVRVVASRTGHAASIVDPGLVPLSACDGSGRSSQGMAADDAVDRALLEQLATGASQIRRAMSLPAFGDQAASITVAPVVVGDSCAAFFVLTARERADADEDARVLVTEHAAMIAGVILGRRRIVAIAAGNARRELFDGLILVGGRNAAKAADWARHLGIEPQSRQRVLLASVSAEHGSSAGATDALEQMLAVRAPAATVLQRDTDVVALVPGDDDHALARQLVETARACRRSMSAQFPGAAVVFGLSDPHTGASTISASYAEARRAVEVGQTLPAIADVVVFAELGVHRLLAHVRDPEDLASYARHVLGPLLEYDRANGTDSCETLGVYFRENSSPKRAAARMHTHPNTIAYRVRRAEEILGMRLGEHGDRLAVELALEILAGFGDRDWSAS